MGAVKGVGEAAVNSIIDATQTFSKTLAKSFVNLTETFVANVSKGGK